ncbi:MAG TPA: hypothetical protein VFR47_32950 [Anaerolineales bacterium]|nr:hypothetical protein [Anaerolineales bacterium]
MSSSNSQIPLACNMSVFTPAERELHIQTTKELFESVQAIRNAEHGYEFNFPNSSETITSMAEFISRERLCCPFLEFTLKVPPGDEPITLLLTGPEGTQDFLRAEFSEAFV